VAASVEIILKNLPSFECLASYAKLQQIKDSPEAFDKVDYDSSKPECAINRQNLISQIRTELRSKINGAEILPKYENCIFEKLTGSESFVHSIVKAAALEHLAQKDNEARPLNVTINSILGEINNSLAICRQADDFGVEFDKLFNSDKKLTTREEYCIKKYLIKNSLIDVYLYDVDPNPHKVNVTGLHCEEMIRKSNEEIYDQLSSIYQHKNPNLSNDEKVECAIEKFREAEYFDLMTKITALTTLNITPEQKSRERENFIEIFSNITSNIGTC
jgi:hypothetical protein